MKKFCVYFAVLLVLATFGMTVLAHAGEMPSVPLVSNSDSNLTEVDTDYEVPISIPTTTEALRLSKTQLQLIYQQEEILTANYAVTWQSSNNAVVRIDPESGKLFAAGVGTAAVTATSPDGRTEICTVTVRYAWWQQLIRIFLFGWLWY